MAFPYIQEANFEPGTNAEWTSESDSANRLDFPHWSMLAGQGQLPFRGAYAMRVALGSATASKVISTAVDIADAATRYVRFYLYVGKDVRFTADDVIQIAEFTQAAGGTVECVIGMRFTAAADTIEIGIGDGAAITVGATGDYSAETLVRGRWYCVEAEILISTGGAGTLKLYIDGALRVSLSSLTNAAAVGDGTLGVVGCLTTTLGTLLFDEYVFDDTRIYPIVDRFSRNRWLTKTGHAFVGAGRLCNVTLVAGAATNNTIQVYDTDRANTNDLFKTGVFLSAVTASDTVDVAGLPVDLKRGCYIVLSGTNPQASVIIDPQTHEQGALVNRGQNTIPNPLEVL